MPSFPRSKISVVLLLSLLILPSQAAFAVHTYYESYITIKSGTIEYNGDSAGEQFGAAVATGDLNGDDYPDLVAGSPFYSGESKDWNGKVSVILGGQDISEGIVNLQFLGENDGDQFGTTLTVGDYNNDGLDDIAVGAYNAYSSGKSPGKVYIIFGKSLWDNQLTSQTIDFALQKPDVVLEGKDDGDSFGLALHTMDMNNDKIADLLIGAPYASSYEYGKTGLVYAYLGGVKDFSERVVFLGRQVGGKFGSAISGGYIFQNDKNDVVIGAYTATVDSIKQAGKVYLYKGTDKWVKGVINPTMTIEGTDQSGWFGFDLAAGDYNDDGFDDLAMTSFPYLDSSKNGHVNLLYGGNGLNDYGKKLFSNSDLIIKIMPETLIGDLKFGSSVMFENLNNDETMEMIVGAPGIGRPYSNYSGDIYVYYNKVGEMGEQTYSVVHGQNPDDWFGYDFSSVDFDRDGFEDLIVGSRYSDLENSINGGKIFVVKGQEDPIGLEKAFLQQEDMISRGDFTQRIVEEFDLKNEKAIVIESCMAHKQFCFFNFSAQSLFDGLVLEPQIILYPDVAPGSGYYDSVNVVTILDLMTGYLDEENSPFHPEYSVSRIQALKVILGATDFIAPKHRFELIEELGSYEELINQKTYFSDVDANIEHMWWYPRYVNFAILNGIVDETDLFRPDDPITFEELDDMIKRTIVLKNEETQP